jgi:hypothetical protein
MSDSTTSPPTPRWRRLFGGRRLWAGILCVLAAAIFAFAIMAHFDDADLRVGKITRATQAYPPSAVPYTLPRKVFVVRTTTQITGCTVIDGDIAEGSATYSLHNELVHGATTLSLTSVTEMDPDSQYYIFFDSGSKSKNLDYAVELYDNGTVKSISASIKDQVAPIAAATIGSLAQIAQIAVPGAGAPRRLPVHPDCTALNAAIAQNRNDPRLSITQEYRWAPSTNDTDFQASAPLGRLTQQFGLHDPRWARLNALIHLQAPTMRPTDTISGAFDCPDAASCKRRPPLAKGLVLRQPIAVLVQQSVCDGACDQTPGSVTLRGDDNLTELPTTTEAIPQLGAIFLVPVHSGFAQDAAVDVAFNPDGLITHLRLQSTSALAASIKELGGQFNTLANTAAGPSTAAINRNLADCLTAQKSVTAAGGAPIGTCK